ncbi:hypothetical protein ASG29_13100 [Sphingomonas sp. Leaf412]|uniref:hypothetical protein n=1 Tax=Sphingomonas sp. Leaf412 TaxID=1736370 RepID=UPI000701656E|nr:hypothetical protein [Sphingomonas sp. Leaf412]KQT32669.1 hypothetical protein ASG29_13100 [Sphingomonas sp. Leaf412]
MPATLAGVVPILLLSACGDRPADTQVLAKVEAQQSAAAADDGRVKCAPAGAATLERVCAVDRTQEARGLLLTVRHPDGGFRRLLVTKDGRGVVAADGAEAAKVTIVDPTEIEVAIGDDVYRLPATVRPKT